MVKRLLCIVLIFLGSLSPLFAKAGLWVVLDGDQFTENEGTYFRRQLTNAFEAELTDAADMRFIIDEQYFGDGLHA